MDAQIILDSRAAPITCATSTLRQVLSMIWAAACRPGCSRRCVRSAPLLLGLCLPLGFSDTGIFGVHAATGQSDIAELVPVIVSELQRTGESILQEELNRARRNTTPAWSCRPKALPAAPRRSRASCFCSAGRSPKRSWSSGFPR